MENCFRSSVTWGKVRRRGKVMQNISLCHEPLSSRDTVSTLYVQYAHDFMMVDIKLRKCEVSVRYFRAALDILQQLFFLRI